MVDTRPMDLEPCPFCGACTAVCGATTFRIECNSCGARGPLWHETGGSAVRDWNSRIDAWRRREVRARDRETRSTMNDNNSTRTDVRNALELHMRIDALERAVHFLSRQVHAATSAAVVGGSCAGQASGDNKAATPPQQQWSAMVPNPVPADDLWQTMVPSSAQRLRMLEEERMRMAMALRLLIDNVHAHYATNSADAPWESWLRASLHDIAMNLSPRKVMSYQEFCAWYLEQKPCSAGVDRLKVCSTFPEFLACMDSGAFDFFASKVSEAYEGLAQVLEDVVGSGEHDEITKHGEPARAELARLVVEKWAREKGLML